DLSMAKADHANASIAYTRALDQEQEKQNQLVELMGAEPGEYLPDISLLTRVPVSSGTEPDPGRHPELQLYKSFIRLNEGQTALLKTQYFPAVSLVGIAQTRASGFGS